MQYHLCTGSCDCDCGPLRELHLAQARHAGELGWKLWELHAVLGHEPNAFELFEFWLAGGTT